MGLRRSDAVRLLRIPAVFDVVADTVADLNEWYRNATRDTRCGEVGPDGVRCQEPRGHEHPHVGMRVVVWR